MPRFVVVRADLLRLGLRCGDRRFLERKVGGLQVTLQMHRREIQRRTDVVEAACRAVFWQQVTQWRVDAEQIVNGVHILGAIQPPVNHAAFRLLLMSAESVQLIMQCFQKGAAHFRWWTLLLLRRHLATLHLVEHFGPLLEVLRVIRLPFQRRQIEPALLRVCIVAVVAVLVEHRLQFAAEFSG